MIRSTCLLPCLLLSAFASAAPPTAEELARYQHYANAEILLVGRVVESQAGPTGMSMPPLYTVRLKVTVSHLFRGDVDADEPLELTYTQRGGDQPRFDAGQTVIVAAKRPHRAGRAMALQATAVNPPEEHELLIVSTIGQLPIGWTLAPEGGMVSPWAKIDGYRWPTPMFGPQCETTGRPALPTGPIDFKVEPIVDPDKQIQWTNPDGDGEYRVTVTNLTDKPLLVPGLFQRDGDILWEQSLVIICQGEARLLPGTTTPEKPIKIVRLDPGESVSTSVNVLALDGIDWPRGGSRVEFLFALGDRGSTQSFYYKSDHHDALRNAE